jgi:hypothetical protein
MKVSETVTILFGSSDDKINNEYQELFKEEIDSLPNAEDFRNATIILAENDINNNTLQSCYGVTLALNILRKNPNTKIILFGILPIEQIRKVQPTLDIVLKYENVYFFNCIPNELRNLTFEKNQNSGDYTVSQEANKYIMEILHTMKYVANWNNPANENERSRIAQGIERTKKYFPVLENASNEEIFVFLEKTVVREEVKKGEFLPGVYCDVEGTLLVDGKINDKIMNLLQKFQQESLMINIWTDGNVNELGDILKNLGVEYPIRNKIDYAGAVAEIVIDDMDEFSFAAYTKISAKKFICVANIN